MASTHNLADLAKKKIDLMKRDLEAKREEMMARMKREEMMAQMKREEIMLEKLELGLIEQDLPNFGATKEIPEIGREILEEEEEDDEDENLEVEDEDEENEIYEEAHPSELEDVEGVELREPRIGSICFGVRPTFSIFNGDKVKSNFLTQPEQDGLGTFVINFEKYGQNESQHYNFSRQLDVKGDEVIKYLLKNFDTVVVSSYTSKYFTSNHKYPERFGEWLDEAILNFKEKLNRHNGVKLEVRTSVKTEDVEKCPDCSEIHFGKKSSSLKCSGRIRDKKTGKKDKKVIPRHESTAKDIYYLERHIMQGGTVEEFYGDY